MQTQQQESSSLLSRDASKRATRWFYIVVLLAVLGVCSPPVYFGVSWMYFRSWHWSEERVAASKSSGEVIIAELRSVRGATGRYPESINQILESLPRDHRNPTAGEGKWRYETRDSGKTCRLSFKVYGKNYVNWYASSEDEFRWYLDN